MLKAPFPYFGGKLKAAPLLWSRFGGDCGNYVEPFFGSGAVWLNRPAEYSGWATVNDLDGNVANAWRAMQINPEAVADAACWPVNECDLHARHLWLLNNAKALAGRLMADPVYHEPRTAGWWIWGACSWIGGGWCAGDGPWHAEPDAEGIATLTNGDGGRGVNRQLPHLGDGGTGVNRRLPHLGDGGTGVNRKLQWLKEWFAELQTGMGEARVCCGDWSRIMSPGTMTRNGTAAVLLDPPYSLTGAVYANDSSTVSGDVREWCKANGDNPKLRIALCGHDTEHNELEAMGWAVETWKKTGGYQGADDRERIWFSPGCIKVETDWLLDALNI
jgi:DNA adenine methylase